MNIECVADTRSRVGEGAVWDDHAGCLWWVDIPAGVIYRFTPSTGRNEAFDIGTPVGCLAVREGGGLVLAAKDGFWTFDPATGQREAITDPEADKPDNRFNDGATDPAGRFWAGSMKDGGTPEAAGAFWRLDPDGQVTHWRGGFYTTNGLAFSHDGRRIWWSDSHPTVRKIWTAPYDLTTGQPGDAEVFVDTAPMAGRPDGATVDADGCYWQAGIDGWCLYRWSPEGDLLQTVDMPVEKPSKPMFGGPDLSTLYVTSLGVGLTDPQRQPHAGSLFAITDLGIRGLPQTPFKG